MEFRFLSPYRRTSTAAAGLPAIRLALPSPLGRRATPSGTILAALAAAASIEDPAQARALAKAERDEPGTAEEQFIDPLRDKAQAVIDKVIAAQTDGSSERLVDADLPVATAAGAPPSLVAIALNEMKDAETREACALVAAARGGSDLLMRTALAATRAKGKPIRFQATVPALGAYVRELSRKFDTLATKEDLDGRSQKTAREVTGMLAKVTARHAADFNKLLNAVKKVEKRLGKAGGLQARGGSKKKKKA